MGKSSRVRTKANPEGDPSPKRLKKNNHEVAFLAPCLVVTERPKSKKELRAEKKAAKKAAAAAVMKSSTVSSPEPLSREEYKLQKLKERKERRREQFKEQLREKRVEKKIRQQKRQNREMNAPRTAKRHRQNNKGEDPSTTKSKSTGKGPANNNKNNEEQEVAMKVLSEVIHGSKDDRSGMTTLQMGVQYKDIVVGTGVMAKNKSLLTMSYKLTGGKFGAVLDSSKSFKFRLGKGEVIQGWDIGCQGMREGGQRKLVVPPKAGYGSQDIGAGPGATLFFDITLLSVR